MILRRIRCVGDLLSVARPKSTQIAINSGLVYADCECGFDKVCLQLGTECCRMGIMKYLIIQINVGLNSKFCLPICKNYFIM